MTLSPHPHQIVAELHQRTRRPTQAQLDALLRRQLSPWSIAGRPGSGEYAVGFARIELDPPCFEFASPVDADMPPSGTPGMVVVALDHFGEPADLVAWPLKGQGCGAWLGAVSMLGAPDAFGPRLDAALTVHPDPWEWLRSERRGVVLLNEKRAVEELRDAGPFAVGSVAFGDRLEALLTLPTPQIYVVAADEMREAA